MITAALVLAWCASADRGDALCGAPDDRAALATRIEHASGSERIRLRLELADLSAALGGDRSLPRSERADAWRERAEILSALGCHREAELAQRHRAELVDEPLELRRALSDAGDCARRAGDHELALAHYRSLLALAPASALHAGQQVEARTLHLRAQLWAGQVASDAGHPDQARAAWRTVVLRAEDPILRVDACDRLALERIASGDLAAAAGWLHHARAVTEPHTGEQTPEGERVRRALVRMRAVDELILATAQRARAQDTPTDPDALSPR